MRAALGLIAVAAACGGGPAARPPVSPVRAAAYEIDHLWIVVSPGAAERAALARAGFQVAPKVNRHDGQGTASVTVELENGFIELIYPDDTVPVSPALTALNAKFKQRADWRTTGYSPFGIGVRRLPAAPAGFPFPTIKVTADWMPAGKTLELLTPRTLPTAVTLFVPAAPSIGDGADPVDPATRVQPNATHRLTGVRVTAPSLDGLPPAAAYLADHGVGTFTVGAAWLMEIDLDDGAQHAVRDLRPELPVVIRY